MSEMQKWAFILKIVALSGGYPPQNIDIGGKGVVYMRCPWMGVFLENAGLGFRFLYTSLS